MTGPLDWPGLVEETLRRRRAERLTQREHAALAGVSVPTLIAFDHQKTSISLAKALDILRVVGLVADTSPSNAQDAFLTAARARWAELTGPLPPQAPARMPHGWYAIDYDINGARAGSARALLEALKTAERHYTGWPAFWIPTRENRTPYPIDGGVECWLGHPDSDRFKEAAHSDFWRASLDARLYLQRGYQEDGVDGLTPATIFDLTLPVWRVGEALLHAHHLAAAMDAADAEVRFRVTYTGLAGRELKSWANPNRDVFDTHRARTGEAGASVACAASAIDGRLAELVLSLLSPIYERFDFFDLPAGLVEEELARLRTGRR